MFKLLRELIYKIFKNKETGADLNNIRRSHNIKYEDITK
tara:strand:- start:510 stop:626 length:117 start_codon:yes stop_codon:yes gene_type:complete